MPVTQIKDTSHVRFAAPDLVGRHAYPEGFGFSCSARGSDFMGGTELAVRFCMQQTGFSTLGLLAALPEDVESLDSIEWKPSEIRMVAEECGMASHAGHHSPPLTGRDRRAGSYRQNMAGAPALSNKNFSRCMRNRT